MRTEPRGHGCTSRRVASTAGELPHGHPTAVPSPSACGWERHTQRCTWWERTARVSAGCRDSASGTPYGSQPQEAEPLAQEPDRTAIDHLQRLEDLSNR